MFKRMSNGLKNWWKTWNMSAEEVYLAQAQDVFEFESRLRQVTYGNWKLRNY
jgi:hypothetical protein